MQKYGSTVIRFISSLVINYIIIFYDWPVMLFNQSSLVTDIDQSNRHNNSRYKISKTGFLNTLGSRQNGPHFADDIFKCIFLNENVSSAIKISLKFVPKDLINIMP